MSFKLMSGVCKKYISSSISSIKSHPSALTHDELDWSIQKDFFSPVSSFNIVSFNLLAPVYKRLPIVDVTTGYRKREAGNIDLWLTRANRTINFFQKQIYDNASIIALQEYWLDERYSRLFEKEFKQHGYSIHLLQRTGQKLDAVALAVKDELFELVEEEKIHLCAMTDRVALLLWLRHKETGQNFLIANTHLSFPHSSFDRRNQEAQVRTLTTRIDMFAERHQIPRTVRILLGDFNVELKSSVCEHLRHLGYYSTFEVSPPLNSLSQNPTSYREKPTVNPTKIKTHTVEETNCDRESNTLLQPVQYVSHRNHKHEDVGVDHIFMKPDLGPRGAFQLSGEEESGSLDSSVLSSKTGTTTDSGLLVDFERLFIDECKVLPGDLSCSTWDEDFFISDHRPVFSKIIFGRKKQ